MFFYYKWLGHLDSNQGWRVQSPLPYHLAMPQLSKAGARDRNRTGMGFNSPRILSPVRLPVSPPGLNKLVSRRRFELLTP